MMESEGFFNEQSVSYLHKVQHCHFEIIDSRIMVKCKEFCSELRMVYMRMKLSIPSIRSMLILLTLEQVNF